MCSWIGSPRKSPNRIPQKAAGQPLRALPDYVNGRAVRHHIPFGAVHEKRLFGRLSAVHLRTVHQARGSPQGVARLYECCQRVVNLRLLHPQIPALLGGVGGVALRDRHAFGPAVCSQAHRRLRDSRSVLDRPHESHERSRDCFWTSSQIGVPPSVLDRLDRCASRWWFYSFQKALLQYHKGGERGWLK